MALITMTIGEHTIELDNDPNSFMAGELGAVERYTGLTLSEFAEKLADQENLSVLAWSALAWIGLRRSGVFTPWDVFVDQLSVIDLIRGMRATDGDVPPAAAAVAVPNRADRRRAAGKSGAATPPVRQGA